MIFHKSRPCHRNFLPAPIWGLQYYAPKWIPHSLDFKFDFVNNNNSNNNMLVYLTPWLNRESYEIDKFVFSPMKIRDFVFKQWDLTHTLGPKCSK